MKPIKFDQVLALADYERVRDILRPLLIHAKERRRLHVGTHLTLLFENNQTVWYQIQEMIRTEKMSTREAIQHEIDTYNEILPGAGELVATMLIEYPEARERDSALRRLVGLERHLWLFVAGNRIPVKFDDRQISEDRLSAVQFVRFSLNGLDSARMLELAANGEIAIEADHPAMAVRGAISPAIAAALAEDLRQS
ncbi:MAG: DUF3501 family protein [Candidatus Binatus sp.]|uniref:DUF3501 family protein n=1 Tax=Candidatus Binatus sp. TaxID=2811406 RepID=UPI002715FBE7|nr:DUF3501 family protein [Candidatus Binatus sp.]MDO8432653.1 DUF3501 family protein [Candidatus Binatus sp.]